VAILGGERLVLRLEPFEGGTAGPMLCRPDASYLVTGGLGGVGLETARWLVERGARHLVLAGRTQLPARDQWLEPAAEPFRRQIDGIRRLEGLGASVQAVALDVAEPGRVDALLEAFRREGRPPIRGVIHSAAVTGDCLIPQLDSKGLFAVLRPKLLGGFALQQAFADGHLDFMVLYSSLGSMLGQPGQASYAAANAFLDALAAEGRRQGRRVLAVNWGGWAGLGLAQTTGARRTIEELERRGVGSFDAAQGLDALGRLLDGDASQALVAPIDWARYAEAAGRTRIPSLVRDQLQGQAVPADAPESSVRAQLEAEADPEARLALLQAHLLEQLAGVLRLPASAVEPQRPMGTLGLESLTALEFRKRLELSLGLRLSATVMWNYPTVAALAGHLAARLVPPAEGAAGAAHAPEPAAGAPGLPLAAVEDMSEDDALRSLMREAKSS
jgi:myxalamid-type polyketide synthase MxaE and MxaD